MKKIFIIIAILVIGCGTFLYITKPTEKLISGVNFSDKNTVVWSKGETQEAIKLADKKLKKCFPDKHKKYKIIQIFRLEAPSCYEIVYGLPMKPTDKQITIFVDTFEKKTILLDTHHE
ncbi:hypothetical protein A2282_02355 [candidate division WOR-1 bacterium RIFOXYA12_FULL_36_13]|nr:MAG: hypothetical protein A2282_02355 [candidate division WOR-1 bacterium RIFOXYA12_FULL_36_13]